MNSISLPTDILQIRKLAEIQSLNFDSSMHLCVKDSCINRISSKMSKVEEQTIEFLENLDHGPPSSRKEAENLFNWFMHMKEKYQNNKNFNIVVFLCGQELVKQVYVQCKTRGNLLKTILSFYHSIFNSKKAKYHQKLEKLVADHEKQVEKLRKDSGESFVKMNNKINELLIVIQKNNEIVAQTQDKVSFYKKKLHELQRVYLEEQDM